MNPVSVVAENTLAARDNEPPSWSKATLLEREIDMGDGSNIRLRGRQRKLNTQMLMGHITQPTLADLLERFEGRGPRTLPEPLLSW